MTTTFPLNEYAKQQAHSQAALAQSGALGACNTVETPLQRIARRIAAATGAINEIGYNLRAHADSLHGEGLDGSKGEQCTRPSRSGAIGAVENELDALDEALGYARDQAARNCTLA